MTLIRQISDTLQGMKQRCYNPGNKSYRYYGARGIGICEEWRHSTIAFQEWCLDNGWRPGLTIDRIDSNKDYCPSNCRWITVQENSKWTKHTKRITVGIYCDTQQGWSKRIGKSANWFTNTKCNHSYSYAYKKLLQEIEKLGGIQKIMGVLEEPDISKILKDIEDDCLEEDL